MNCEEFRNKYLGPDRTGSEVFMECMDHIGHCISCRDHAILVQLENKGVDVARYPCVHMAEYATFECETHIDLLECPDALVVYDREFDQYAINDPGPAVTPIRFCPWCAASLPDRSEQWFAELEALGFDDPFSQDIPEKFKSDAWYTDS